VAAADVVVVDVLVALLVVVVDVLVALLVVVVDAGGTDPPVRTKVTTE
jgi:hypothetical protein